MAWDLEGSDGTNMLFNTLEEAYNYVVNCIEKPDRWHRMLLHHVRELFQGHTVAHTRLVVQVAFTDDKKEWYELQMARP